MDMLIIDDVFNSRLNDLNLSLFEQISSQSTDADRRSWLAVQRSIRRSSGYTYLEIGSHLGGSIQQHLLDPLCKKIISIDKRPLNQPDDRGGGEIHDYEGNSTTRMIKNLLRVAPDELGKLFCYDSDAKDIVPSSLPASPDFCFIDGEHTYAAVLSDFEFCLSVCSPNAAICFHDDYVTWKALRVILSSLRQRGIPFTARKISDFTFGIFLRNCPALNDPFIRECSQNGFVWLEWKRIQELLRRLLPRRLKATVRWMLGWLKSPVS